MNKYLFVIPFVALLILGTINTYQKATWKEPYDGVFWKHKKEGLVAVKVEKDGPAFSAGIREGDILYAINGNLIKNKIDLVKNLWVAGIGGKVIYQVNREGQILFPTFKLVSKSVTKLYFYLVLIGLITLVIGLIVILNSKKPITLPYVYFYLLALTFFSFYVFSPTGKLDSMDLIFYWLDKIAFLLFPPLLFHFFLIFPQRSKIIKKSPTFIPILYVPALFLIGTRIFFHTSKIFSIDPEVTIRVHQSLSRIELIHFGIFSIFILCLLLYNYRKTKNLLIKTQLKWILYGLGIGTFPFILFYIIPFSLGKIPSSFGELTVILQALIPLTFAYSISKYKLMDFEILLKKAATLIFSFLIIATIYFIVTSKTKVSNENRLTAIVLGLIAIILGATLFSPLKKFLQNLFDKIFYRKSYYYRRSLLAISKRLSSERDLDRLSQSLIDLISNAISINNLALLLPQREPLQFKIYSGTGKKLSAQQSFSFSKDFIESLQKREFIIFYSYQDMEREFPEDYKTLYLLGFFHYLPFKVDGKIVGCLGMGKKKNNSFLTSEDWDLLKTISTPAALALENAYLYNQAQERSRELERLKDYSQNIIESLTVGVLVLDREERIISWNRVLENFFKKRKEEVINRKIKDVFGEENYKLIFPTKTQENLRLLSEISLTLPSGEKRIFDIMKTPLLDNNFKPYGTIIVFDDITEKITLQQQLLTSEKLASLGLLSAGIAHEINTPLTGISSYVQMLQKSFPSNDPKLKLLQKIESQTERVAKIIKTLLNFSRQPDFSFYKVDLSKIIQEILSLVEYKLKKLNINVELNFSKTSTIWANGEKLQQVFVNLILNAIDAMPNGGKLIIELSENKSEAIIKIRDTGIGIRKEHIPHIFDPFFTTKGLGKGTGLGLSISYAIIREHEGQIFVDSEVGKGTTFTIKIPKDLHKRRREAQ
ncbi:ATP-binding protein [Candidatus Aminicenantes bacterium AC-335-B20]|jgi:PAS domain S-box-containing protein|nr:ATP-binding protein [SCandidatus Aminicenantes bacterium Aminicenantia_JdfR_composite]MCP2598888.1 ATP-binding protein [Candidatus Aminicenantes bacterium AC-335-B20]